MKGLKACPFCGAEANIYRRIETFQENTNDFARMPIFETRSDHRTFIVACGNSECPAEPSCSSRDKSEAIQKWNKRAELIEKDRVHLIRCKDCKYYRDWNHDQKYGYCDYLKAGFAPLGVDKSDWCCWAEGKKDE